MANPKPSTNAAGEPVRRTEQVTEQGSDSPRLKASPRGYLVIAGTGAVLTPEMVKDASEDPPLGRLTEELLETAAGMHRIGVMDDATYQEITLRLLGPQASAPKKAPTKKVPNRAVEAILEMADDQLHCGLITQAEHDQIAIRHSRPPAPGAAKSGSAEVKGTPIRKKN